MALSSDSTCTNHLFSAQDGYETLHLEKEEAVAAEDEASAHPQCVFPDWMQGAWEGVTIEGGEMVYRDEVGFATYRGRCVTTADHVDRFVVNLKSDCGEPAHYCALFQQRDVNVMEFQLGKSLKHVLNLPAYGFPVWRYAEFSKKVFILSLAYL